MSAAGASRLRPMRWWDIEALQPLEQLLFPTNAWPAEAFWGELALGPHRLLLVAESDDGALIGYAGLSCPPQARGADAEIMTVAVAPKAQGRGVARALVEALCAEAERRGAGRLMLEVRVDNAPARALYDHLGFETVATRRGYYPAAGSAPPVDALVMRRRLPAADPPADAPVDPAVDPAADPAVDTVPR